MGVSSAPGEALAAQLLDDLAGAVRRAGNGDDIGLALQSLGDLRRDIEALELDADRVAVRDVVGLEDRRIELGPRDVRDALIRDIDDVGLAVVDTLLAQRLDQSRELLAFIADQSPCIAEAFRQAGRRRRRRQLDDAETLADRERDCRLA